MLEVSFSVFFIYHVIVRLSGVRFGEKLGADDAHHDRPGRSPPATAGVQHGGGGPAAALWGGVLFTAVLHRLSQW